MVTLVEKCGCKPLHHKSSSTPDYHDSNMTVDILSISFCSSDHDDNHDHDLFLEISMLSDISHISPCCAILFKRLAWHFSRVVCVLSSPFFTMSKLCAPVYFEPQGPELLEVNPCSKVRLEKARWLPLFQIFSSHNSKVTKYFSLNLVVFAHEFLRKLFLYLH